MNIFLCIYLVFSLNNTKNINALFVSIGNYSEYVVSDVNLPECGLRNVEKRTQIRFNTKCFGNNFENKTYIESNGLIVSGDEYIINRIFRGSEAAYGEAPWAVYVSPQWLGIGMSTEEYYCSGVLVTFEWVLTAAHCIDQNFWRTTAVNAGGKHKNGMETRSAQRDKWYPHPNYRDSQGKEDQRHDISLIKLESKFTRQRIDGNVYVINTICLPDRDYIVKEPDKTTLFGFGFMNALGKRPDYLQKADIEIIKSNYCNHNKVICAKPKGSVPRACYGDSGGGLVQYINKFRLRAVLAGTVIGGAPRGAKCGEAIKEVQFVSVSHHIDWILETIKNN